MTEKRMTEQEFQTAIKSLTLAAKTVDIARHVLVEGNKQTVVAAARGISKGAVSQIVSKVWEARLMHEGYEQVTAILPKHQAFIVRKWAKSAKKGESKA